MPTTDESMQFFLSEATVLAQLPPGMPFQYICNTYKNEKRYIISKIFEGLSHPCKQ